jgi:hypothetical protein
VNWWITVFIGRSFATVGSVNTPTYNTNVRQGEGGTEEHYLAGFHVLQVHTDLCGDAIPKSQI